jgi:hypothetical protein
VSFWLSYGLGYNVDIEIYYLTAMLGISRISLGISQPLIYPIIRGNCTATCKYLYKKKVGEISSQPVDRKIRQNKGM